MKYDRCEEKKRLIDIGRYNRKYAIILYYVRDRIIGK